MKTKITLLLFLVFGCSLMVKGQNNQRQDFIILIHGGAGYKTDYTDSILNAHFEVMEQALEKAYNILNKGGHSVDAVEAAIILMEDSPLFNAGKGAVYTEAGTNELDASIMNGENLMAGAVASVTTIKNPITAARAVMEKSKHVMMSGKGAENFAKENDLIIVPPDYFKTSENNTPLENTSPIQQEMKNYDTKHFGTVGAVALDKNGNLAAGTSTGGMSGKKYGRIGDSPIIGAGTYANNQTCAVSSTGHGEFFIRNVLAYNISALIEYKNLTLSESAEYMILEKLSEQGGNGGIIAVDKDGNFVMITNTDAMFRGYYRANGEKKILLVDNPK